VQAPAVSAGAAAVDASDPGSGICQRMVMRYGTWKVRREGPHVLVATDRVGTVTNPHVWSEWFQLEASTGPESFNMSPEFAAFIQEVFASVPAGAEAVEVEYAKFTFRPADSITGAAGQGGGALAPALPAQGQPEPPSPDCDDFGSGDPASWTPLERVEASVAARGDDDRKLKDWQSLFAGDRHISGRELDRAVKAGLLRYSHKAGGKDSGAFMIAASDLAAYLRERESRLAEDHLPEEWRLVVGPRPRNER
jgi:hypothetical protein